MTDSVQRKMVEVQARGTVASRDPPVSDSHSVSGERKSKWQLEGEERCPCRRSR
jgi:hypothetical protein